ncbi:MAG: hypothetical protein NVS3B12_04890 [Acidimicrobiales bacterium]
MNVSAAPRRRPASSAAWTLAAIGLELLLYRSYQGHDARFHWFTHFFVGASFALVVMAAVSWRIRRPVRRPLLWLIAGHLYAMAPDIAFSAAGVPHRRWMDVFLGHISSHFIPGHNLTWFAVFLTAAGLYLAIVDGCRPDLSQPAGLAVRTWGAGPPVVFLHGLGASRRLWDSVAGNSSGYRGIAPDLLGFGRSPHPEGATYDVATHLAALDAVVPEGAVLVGHSTGSILAAAFAAAYPGRVSSLLLVSLPAYPDLDHARRDVARLGAMARWTVTGNPLGMISCWLMCRTRPLLLPIAPLVGRDVPASVASDFLLHDWASYSGTLLNVVVAHRVEPDLARSALPLVLLHGAADHTAPVDDVEDLVARLRSEGRDPRLTVVDTDHLLPVRRPEAVADALRGLISSGS